MFQVDQKWKSKNSDTLSAIFSQVELRYYRLVELPLNLQLFHVDAVVVVDGESYYTRFICDNFTDVIEQLLEADFSNIKISLQSRRVDDRDYVMRTVEEVFESVSNPGLYSYRCGDGTLQGDSMYESLLDITDAHLIWSSG